MQTHPLLLGVSTISYALWHIQTLLGIAADEILSLVPGDVCSRQTLFRLRRFNSQSQAQAFRGPEQKVTGFTSGSRVANAINCIWASCLQLLFRQKLLKRDPAGQTSNPVVSLALYCYSMTSPHMGRGSHLFSQISEYGISHSPATPSSSLATQAAKMSLPSCVRVVPSS